MSNISFKNGIKKALFNVTWTCNVCGNEVFNSDYFCKTCIESLPIINENFCEHCGRLTVYPTSYCDSCKQKNINFDKARSAFSYEEPIDKLIQNYKYNKKLYLVEVFSYYLVGILLNNFSDADIITYVPSTKARIKERGYNQSKVLAEEVAKTIGKTCVETSVKIKDTLRQATLNADERLDNLRGSFKIINSSVKDKNVLIIDDVLTTGTTSDYLAKLFKRAGAKKVYLLTIASVSRVKYLVKED